jgi:serine/threonine-protein kinase
VSATVPKGEPPESEPTIRVQPQAPSIPSLLTPMNERRTETEVPSLGTSKDTLQRSAAEMEALAAAEKFSIRRGVVLGGRFCVKELIGAGAQCYVFSAEHTTLRSQVAIKCLRPELVTVDRVERFAREAHALTAIRNAHVAAVFDVGRAPCGTPFIVMEYLHGRDLAALLEMRPRLEGRQAAETLLQVCEGLAAAHALGLCHQDIKPSNIFLSDEMGIVKAKVVDFGVARVSLSRTSVSGRASIAPSALDDEVGGTPLYMAPEQLRGRAIDPRSDIFSLGMVLYEMLRGTPAFDLEMSTRQPGDPVRILRTGLDQGLADVIEKCVKQDPDDRYSSVAALAAALLRFAPRRARGHAEAAAALLRKAGVAVETKIPSSIPPPPSSSLDLPQIPPAPPTPGAFQPSETTKSPSRLRLVALIGIPLLLALFAIVAFVAMRAGATLARRDAPIPIPSASAAPPESSAPSIRIGATARPPPEPSVNFEADEPAASAKPLVGLPRGARPPTRPGASGSARAAASASAPAPARSGAPTGTSEDFGF